MQEFKDKLVVISGGVGDIGQAMAIAFLDAGSTVCLADKMDLEQATQKFPLLERESRLHYQQVDISDYEQVTHWLLGCRERYGALSICIPNASRVTLKNFQSISAQEWKDELDVNLHGAFYMANEAARLFIEDKVAGNIVFLGSWAGHAVHKNLPTYSVSKAAVRMLCQSMALEFANYGIRVNEVAPGYVNAGLSKVVWADAPEQQTAASKVVPLGSILESEEVAKQVLWICSENSRLLTGATIVLDGGLSLLRP